MEIPGYLQEHEFVGFAFADPYAATGVSRSSLLGDRRSRSRYSIVFRARPPVASQRRRWLLRSLPR
eukprot:707298-Prymnesium_polylepis.1